MTFASIGDDDRSARPIIVAASAIASHIDQFGLPQHFLYFLPEPHGHGSFEPTFG